jgi:pyrroline-5-carboxylate reductase
MKIGFIGGGNMATAIISGLKTNGFAMQNIAVVEPSAEKRAQLSQQFNVLTHDSIENILENQVIVLAVKPQQLKEICQALSTKLTNQLIISIAAGIRALDISRWLNHHKNIVRVMPNTPAQIQAGISALFALTDVTQSQRDEASMILNAVGKTIWLDDEQQMDAVTAISGSGPAYVFYLIEALQEAAINLGLSQENARLLALETFAGASQLAKESHENVSVLRAQVTSKGGTTEQGILVMESANIKEIMFKTAKAAADKSVILGDALGA